MTDLDERLTSGLEDCVLVVEDEFLIAASLKMQIEDLGMVVCGTADTALSAISMAETHRPRVILMDMRLKGAGDGVDAALAIHRTVGSKVIFITGSREPATMARIQEDHPAAVLFKPIYGRQLQTAIETVLAG
ncbi:response regulator [Phenylobacterium aquaticum]|uniref:response regulator n=1 Tax=Phenylobacterium aquaticum TaxID=1763816 RepID=UPI0026EABACC|nr:response regulator [Phenylobacterium aquaticum]